MSYSLTTFYFCPIVRPMNGTRPPGKAEQVVALVHQLRAEPMLRNQLGDRRGGAPTLRQRSIPPATA